MTLRISRRLTDAIRAHARAAAPHECCGLLLGADDEVSAIVPATNVADVPTHRFEIDPNILLAAHKAARNGGPAILGCYHSHPGGDPAPSTTDGDMAEGRGEYWLIVGEGEALRGWRAVGAGQFEPVEFVDGVRTKHRSP